MSINYVINYCLSSNSHIYTHIPIEVVTTDETWGRKQRMMSPCSSRWQWAAADWRNQRKYPSLDRAPRQADPSGSLCLTRTRQVFNKPSFTAPPAFIVSDLENIKCLWAGFIDVDYHKPRKAERSFNGDTHFLGLLSVTLTECRNDHKFFTGLRLEIWHPLEIVCMNCAT